MFEIENFNKTNVSIVKLISKITWIPNRTYAAYGMHLINSVVNSLKTSIQFALPDKLRRTLFKITKKWNSSVTFE